jgi:hypothetical protein
MVMIENSSKEAEAKKAESWQALKAFLIPLTLFLACIGAAAGSFLIYNHESLGWVFLVVCAVTIILNFIGLIHFQNKLRVKGMIANDEKNG